MSERARPAAMQSVGVAGLLRLHQPPDPALLQQRQEQAVADAFAQGYHAGEAAAACAADARQQSQMAQQAGALAAATATQETMLQAVAESLVELGLAIARAAIAAEPLARPETLRSLVAEALAAAPAEATGTVAIASAALPAEAIPAGWMVVVDPALPVGTVRATVGAASFTASFDRRLSQLSALLHEVD